MYELFVHQWRPLLLCFLITAGGTVAFYTYSVNGPKMIQSAFAGNDPMTGTLINLGVLAFLMVLQPVGGWLSDIIGRKTLLVFFGVGGVLYSWYLITAAAPARRHPGLPDPGTGVRHPHRLHLDQRGGEGRAVPHPRARWAWAWLCAGQLAVRRHRPAAVPGRAEDRPRRLVRHLRDRDDRGIVGGLCVLPHQQGPNWLDGTRK
jgi:MFS family permease